MKLDDLGHFGDLLGEALEPGVGMFAGDNRNIDAKTKAQFFRRQQRDAARDDAGRLEFLDALPAGRLRQADPRGDLGDGQGSVVLQNGEIL